MASATIDTLQVKISASASEATTALNALANSLNKVKKAFSNIDKDGFKVSDHVAQSVLDINRAVNLFDISRLKSVTATLNEYAAALKTIKGIRGNINLPKISENVKDTQEKIIPAKSGTIPSSWAEEDVGGKGSKPPTTKDVNTIKGLTEKYEKAVEVFQRIKGVTSKASSAIKELGEKIKLTSGSIGKLIKAIGRIALYRAIRAAIKAITKAFEEGLKNAYMYSQQTEGFERLANALDRLKSVTSQMVNQIGAFWGEFRQFIQPAIEWLIEKVRQLSEFLTELFAALNGDTVYQYALLEDLKWQEATEDLKKYKHQLLGLDELNNLTANQSGKKDDNDATTKYELRPVREAFRAIGSTVQDIKKAIEDAFKEIGELALLPIGMTALGLLMIFTGNWAMGIPVFLKGVQWTVEEVGLQNDDLRKKIEGFFQEYQDLFDTISAASVAIGTMLLFVPGQRALGLGLIMGGVMLKNLVHDKVKFSWGGLLKTIEEKFESYKGLFSRIGRAAVAVGTMLLFVPGLRGLGLGLILAGTSVDTLASAKDFSWGGLLKTVQEKFADYRNMFNNIGAAAVAIGTLLMFVPGMQGIGLGLILNGTGVLLLANSEDFDWDHPLESMKKAFDNIQTWWKGTVKTSINKAINWIEEKLHFDLNKDNLIGGLWEEDIFVPATNGMRAKNITGSGTFTTDGTGTGATYNSNNGRDDVSLTIQGTLGEWAAEGVKDAITAVIDDTTGLGETITTTSWWEKLWEDTKNDFDLWARQAGWYKIKIPFTGKTLGDFISPDAAGAIEKPGSFFYAGEAGPEFIGRMGNSSAIANTEQMTDAIYKAAYMGMSQALRENGGNGLAGFVPATTDDLFIAMRKKASNYNKATGSSAFA